MLDQQPPYKMLPSLSHPACRPIQSRASKPATTDGEMHGEEEPGSGPKDVGSWGERRSISEADPKTAVDLPPVGPRTGAGMARRGAASPVDTTCPKGRTLHML